MTIQREATDPRPPAAALDSSRTSAWLPVRTLQNPGAASPVECQMHTSGCHRQKCRATKVYYALNCRIVAATGTEAHSEQEREEARHSPLAERRELAVRAHG